MATTVRPVQVARHVRKNYLNGIFCIYKPTGMTTINAVSIVKRNVIKELNELPAYDYEVDQYFNERFSLSAAVTKTNALVSTNVPGKIKDFSRHKLVLGNMFVANQFSVRYVHGVGEEGSGVVVCGVGRKGREMLELIKLAKYLRVYHVKGRFGYATDNFFPSGNFIERTTYKHINKGKMDKYCGAAQSLHQRRMFEYAGIDPASEEAYKLACQGLVRPSDDKMPPMLYGVKCVYFNPPDFTLEVHAINEMTEYLAELVNDIGLKLKTTAVCTHVHRLRYGIFDLDYALLKKEWHLKDIIRNITKCQSILTPDKLMTNIQIDSAGRDSKTDVLSISGKSNDGISVDDILKEKNQEHFKVLREKIKNFSLEDSSESSEETVMVDLDENKGGT